MYLEKTLILKDTMHRSVYSSTIYNSQYMEEISMFIER